MARRKKPCEFCEEEWATDYKTHRNGYCLWVEIYPFNNIMTAWAQSDDENGYLIEDSIDISLNYCPECGRKLTE